jgi:hypothetical protein
LSARDLSTLRQEVADQLDVQRVDSEVNYFLRQELLATNERDPDAVNKRLDAIQEALSTEVEEFDRLLFGGSIAKHTYVEGLSDVDSLVILKDAALAERSPEEFRAEFVRVLRARLKSGDVDDILMGHLAVTVRFRDGTELQLLPAVQRGDSIAISSSDGLQWRTRINPRAFTDQLTAVNGANGGMVVPVIKLAKQVAASAIPEQNRPSGYLLEAIATEAFTRYQGPRTPKSMLSYLMRFASDRVKVPTPDPTGQSRNADDALGPAGSPIRQELARRLSAIADTMEKGRDVDDWRRLFE